jgi:hypothetical protein
MNPARDEILNKLKSAVHSVPEEPDFEKPIYHSIEFTIRDWLSRRTWNR